MTEEEFKEKYACQTVSGPTGCIDCIDGIDYKTAYEDIKKELEAIKIKASLDNSK